MAGDTEALVRKLCARAINQAGGEVLRQSALEVPLDDSELLGSGRIEQDATPYRLEVVVAYGTPYGAAQHEGWAIMNRNGVQYLWIVRHYTMPGRKRKFLEDPAKRVGPMLDEDIAAILRAAL